MPDNVRRRIMLRAKENQPVVLTFKNGKPSQVIGYEEYRKMKEHPAKHRPWQHRKAHQPAPDPLGAVDGRVLESLGRDKIYE